LKVQTMGHKPRHAVIAGMRADLLARRVVGLAVLLAACAAVLLPAAAHADGSPSLTLTESVPERILFGADADVTLTATNPGSETETAYNLSFRYVLPAGTSYAGGAATAPRILSNAPAAGQTTLLFENVADLPPGASYPLTFQVAHSTTARAVGDTYTTTSGVYANSNPRWVPDFDPSSGTAITGPASYTGSATSGGSTRIVAVLLDKDEPSPEAELLRGAHDHRTIYTLKLRNNHVNPTGDLELDDWLPAGLEFLGCGTAGDDNTTAGEEYPGSGPLNGSTLSGITGTCPTPTVVETVEIDPDGPTGPMQLGVYTHVHWHITPELDPSEVRDIQYVAAIPSHENTLDFNGIAPGNGTAPAIGGAQGSNLDNNTGPETVDEQELTNYASVSATYDGSLAVQDDATLTRIAEDIRLLKSVDPDTLVQGDTSEWTLRVDASEYRTANDVVVTDTVPDGLCPLAGTGVNYEHTPPAASAECDGGAGLGPSPAYATPPVENADGTWTLTWDIAHIDVSDGRTITFHTRTRENYQEGYADDTPVATADAVENHAALTSDSELRCTPDPNCGGGSTPISADPPTRADVDESDASISADHPELDKRIQQSTALVDCDDPGTTYAAAASGPFRPGDQVCYRLRIEFPDSVDTRDVVVTDFLPPNTTYVPGSAAYVGGNTAPVVTPTLDPEDGRFLTWNEGDVDISDVFEAVIAVTVQSTPSLSDEDITENLLKLRYANTPGAVFPLRADVPVELHQPDLQLLKGVRTINGDTPRGPNVDNLTINGGDSVEYRVDVSNAPGALDADDMIVWDRLPAQFDCTMVHTISAGGACVDGGADRDVVKWLASDLGAGATTTLTYVVDVPDTFVPNTSFVNEAGVVTYTGTTNHGTPYTYTPVENIDPDAPAGNAAAVDDPSSVHLPQVGVDKVVTSSDLTQTGNNGGSQATPGEVVTYTVTTTIPEGTVLHGDPTLTDPIPASFELIAGSATATLDTDGSGGGGGVALPTSGWTVGTGTGELVLAHPGEWDNPEESGDDVIVVTYRVRVLDAPANARGSDITNTATFAYETATGTDVTRNDTATVRIVEPNVSIAKSHANAAPVVPGDQRAFTVTATNTSGTNVSTANDVVVVDTLPPDLFPVDGDGDPIADGDPVGSPAGVWDEGARTITWTLSALAPGAHQDFTYTVEVDDDIVSGGGLENSVALTATSHTGTPAGDRSYSDDDTDSLSIVQLSGAKSVTPDEVTIGAPTTYTVDVTIPGGVNAFDATVLDQLPAHLTFESIASTTCTGCTGPVPQATAVGPDGSNLLALFLGDIAQEPASRTLHVHYTAHVADTWTAGTLTNTIDTYSNTTDEITGTPPTPPAPGSFDNHEGPDTATISVVEPHLTIDKTVTGDGDLDDARPTEPGDTYTYSVAVHNDGDSPAYGVVVRDTPDAGLTSVVATDGASMVTHAWSDAAGERYTQWLIPGPIAPGATVTLKVTAALAPSSGLTDGQTVVNTAEIASYRGRSAADCAVLGAVCRDYTGPSDTVTLTVDLPSLSLVKTTGLGGSPDTGPAQVGQAFPWRIVTTNGATTATAKSVTVRDVLPAGWTYKPGTATTSAGTIGDPTIVTAAGGDTLTWSDVTDLAPGAAVTVGFEAIPTTDALATGTGSGNPHVNTASASGQDSSGSGTYPSNSDTAEAILSVPSLTIEKTPDAGAATAGTATSWSIHVTNTGAVPARHVRVRDVIPAGMSYVAGAATAAPTTGFSEVSYDASTRTAIWEVAELDPSGGDVTITVPVAVDADIAPGTTLTNTARASSDEQPTPVSDDGAIDVDALANVRVAKDGPATALAGEQIEYTLRVDNDGPSDARDVTLTDVLPASLTFVSATGCSAAGQTVTCDLGQLATGGSATRTLRVKIAPSATAPIDNTATVATSTPQTSTADDSDTASTVLIPSADLSIAKTADPATLRQGDTTTFTLTVRNDGPSDAAGVEVRDRLPDGLTPLRARPSQGTCTIDGQDVRCAMGAVGNAATASVAIDARADATGSRTNTATVTATTPDPDPTDDEASATVQVDPVPEPPKADAPTPPAPPAPSVDLSVVKTSTLLMTGADATYTLTVRNAGPAEATGVVLTDQLPAGVTYVRSEQTQGTCNATGAIVTCALGKLAAGTGAAVQLVVKVTAAPGTTVRNVATVASTQVDAHPEDNTGAVEGPVAAPRTGGLPTHRLELTKTADVEQPAVGERFSYRIAVKNAGGSAATAVEVTDPMPEGVAIVKVAASQGSCTSAGGVVSCKLGTLAAGATATVRVDARATEPGKARNVALVTADGKPDPKGDRVAGYSVDARTSGRLSAVKRALRKSVVAGESVTFRLTVRAAGAAVKNVKVCDLLPSGLVFDRARGAKFSDGRACWTVKALKPGRATTYTVVARTERDAGGTLVNRMTATAIGVATARSSASIRVTTDSGIASAGRGGGVTG